MKHFTLIFAACLCIAIVAVPQPKTKAVPVDEVELMLEKISSHLQEASVATAQAHKMSDKMVEEKVAEKAELKEAVVKAEEKVEKMEEKIEVFAVKMVGAGLDTTTTPIEFKGVIYDAYLNYLSEGGKEEFDYFRMYLWQQK
jgi:Na+/phosphate symporter